MIKIIKSCRRRKTKYWRGQKLS